MIYLRGIPFDFECWNSIAGADWDNVSVQQAFEEMESMVGIDSLPMPELHPALAEFLRLSGNDTTYAQWQQAFQPTLGIGPYTRLQMLGRRLSAWDIWIEGRLMRSGPTSDAIHVSPSTLVQSVVIDDDRVTGLIVAKTNQPNSSYAVAANKGVIVCNGAIHSPELLLRSGIGDTDDLRQLGIPARLHSPLVGKNLQDHLIFPVIRAMNEFQSLQSAVNRTDRLQYVRERSGPRTSNIAELGGFFQSDSSAAAGTANVPDFQWHVTPSHYLEYPLRPSTTNALSVGVTDLRPQSRGTVRLVPSSDASDKNAFSLEIDPHYLSSEADRTLLRNAVQWTRSQLDSSTFGRLLAKEILPGAKRASDDQCENAIVHFATTLYHYSCTCSMGSAGSSVVDCRFAVHGLDGLWVCDASAMPNLVSANPQATVMMMAYRLAGWL